MDPTTTYDLMTQYMSEGDWLAAEECARDLRNWLFRGGFAPKHVSLERVYDLIRFVIAKAQFAQSV